MSISTTRGRPRQSYLSLTGTQNRPAPLSPEKRAAILAEIGTMSDRSLATKYGIGESCVQKLRLKHRVRAFQRPEGTGSAKNHLEAHLPHFHAMTAKLVAWPHKLPGIGLSTILVLHRIHQQADGLIGIDAVRHLTTGNPFAGLIRHQLVQLHTRSPLVYAMTDKGREYHTLLQHANLIPDVPAQ